MTEHLNQMHQTDFDKNPPMPLNAYEQTVKSVNIGYDLTFQLVECFLAALGKSDLHILVVGAGGGAELERFLPHNPGWNITGIDPSQQMLTQAQAKVTRLNLTDRVTLQQGTVDQLQTTMRFDAATCLYVLHFLPDDSKLETLRTIKNLLQPGAPLYLISAVRGATMDVNASYPTLKADFFGAWQQYGELMGMPAAQMMSTIEQLTKQISQPQVATAETIQNLAHEAGFTHVAPFCSMMEAIYGWIAR
jgi:tRNA (cmo5U34)-methyltransferase